MVKYDIELHIRCNEMNIIDLLSNLVSYKTVNDPLRNIRPGIDIAKYIRDILSDWGIESQIIESNGYYSVYGSIGSGKPYIMLLAHFDTVPVDPSKWDYDPFKLTIVGNKAYGRGALDDKANVAALMLVLKDLVKRDLKVEIFFAFTGDEEIGGANGARVIAEKLYKENMLPKYLINGDGYGMKIINRRRKAFRIELEVPVQKAICNGILRTKIFKAYYPLKQYAHAAYFHPGTDIHPLITASVFIRENNVYVVSLEGKFLKSNVIPDQVILKYVEPGTGGTKIEYDKSLTQLLKALYPVSRLTFPTDKPSEYGITITPNVYELNNYIHKIHLDLRAMVNDKSIIENELSKLLHEILPESKYKVITGTGSYMYTDKKSIIIQAFKSTLMRYGYEPEISEGAGATDSRYFTTYGVEAVDFGPLGGNIHGDNEYVEIKSLQILPKIYLNTIEFLIQDHG